MWSLHITRYVASDSHCREQCHALCLFSSQVLEFIKSMNPDACGLKHRIARWWRHTSGVGTQQRGIQYDSENLSSALIPCKSQPLSLASCTVLTTSSLAYLITLTCYLSVGTKTQQHIRMEANLRSEAERSKDSTKASNMTNDEECSGLCPDPIQEPTIHIGLSHSPYDIKCGVFGLTVLVLFHWFLSWLLTYIDSINLRAFGSQSKQIKH